MQLSSLKSQLEEEKIRLEKMHGNEMENLLKQVTSNFVHMLFDV